MNASIYFKKMLRSINKNISYDESLHSLLFRMIHIHQPESKPVGIISKSGGWVKNPYAPKSTWHIFHGFPDHVLLEIIDAGKLNNRCGGNFFDFTTDYTKKIERVFFTCNETKYSSLNSGGIKFCHRCIKESIINVGYGYFRHFWEPYFSCLIHNEPLRELPFNGFSNAVKQVHKILRGDELVNESVILDKPKHTNFNSTDDCKIENHFFPLKTTYCSMNAFAVWIQNNQHYFGQDFWRRYNLYELMDILSRAHKKGFEGIEGRIELSNVYLILSQTEPVLLEAFFTGYIEFFTIQLGPRQQGILKEVIIKDRSRRCDSCKVKNCYMKNFYNISNVRMSSINYEYLLQHSYSLKRLAMQERSQMLVGPFPWGGMNVTPWLAHGEMANAF